MKPHRIGDDVVVLRFPDREEAIRVVGKVVAIDPTFADETYTVAVTKYFPSRKDSGIVLHKGLYRHQIKNAKETHEDLKT